MLREARAKASMNIQKKVYESILFHNKIPRRSRVNEFIIKLDIKLILQRENDFMSFYIYDLYKQHAHKIDRPFVAVARPINT